MDLDSLLAATKNALRHESELFERLRGLSIGEAELEVDEAFFEELDRLTLRRREPRASAFLTRG